MEAGIRDPDLLLRIEDVIFRLLEPACRTVAAPDRKFAIRPEESPSHLQINPYDVRAFSLTSLTKRLRVAGISKQTCDEVVSRGESYYDAAWAEYEKLQGEEHPYRYFDRLAAATS